MLQTPFRSWRASLVLLFAAGLALSACAGVTGLTGGPRLYTLTPKSTFDADLPRVDWQLLVEPPVTAAGLDTTRIALSRSPLTLDYFAGVSWADRAPLMVQRLLVESFENSGRIVAVGRDTVGLRADYLLKTELREFQAEYAGDPVTTRPQVRVRLNAKLVGMPRRAIVASETFEAVVPVRGNQFEDIVTAFDDALGQVLKGTVQWALRRGEAARAAS